MGKKKPRKGGDDDWENDVEQMEAGDAPEAEPTKFKGLIFHTHAIFTKLPQLPVLWPFPVYISFIHDKSQIWPKFT